MLWSAGKNCCGLSSFFFSRYTEVPCEATPWTGKCVAREMRHEFGRKHRDMSRSNNASRSKLIRTSVCTWAVHQRKQHSDGSQSSEQQQRLDHGDDRLCSSLLNQPIHLSAIVFHTYWTVRSTSQNEQFQ